MNAMKEEILGELERRVSLSCSSCQSGVEDMRMQQKSDQERISALEKLLPSMDQHYRHNMGVPRREMERTQGCCNTLTELGRSYDVIKGRLDKELGGGSGSGGGGGGGGEKGGRTKVMEEKLNSRLRRELERRLNNTVRKTEQKCTNTGNIMNDNLQREVTAVRNMVLSCMDDHGYRIGKLKPPLLYRFTTLNDSVKGLGREVQRHGNTLTDLGSTKDNILSEVPLVCLVQGERGATLDPKEEKGPKANLARRGSWDLQVQQDQMPMFLVSALTRPQARAGTIVFNKVFVNKKEVHNQHTGYFTAPASGKYLFSATLTGHKNVKIEAVLSKCNYGVARYQSEGLEKTHGRGQTHAPMKVGDTVSVCVDLVTGKLAHSSEALTIFSGMLLYETV
ncbi:unnamed protein product [Coregonus sp. 'balchen']|nr:unnamed protein product [Coregonus sp. 'balchen']